MIKLVQTLWRLKWFGAQWFGQNIVTSHELGEKVAKEQKIPYFWSGKVGEI